MASHQHPAALREFKKRVAQGKVEAILRGPQRNPLQLAFGNQNAILIGDQLIEHLILAQRPDHNCRAGNQSAAMCVRFQGCLTRQSLGLSR